MNKQQDSWSFTALYEYYTNRARGELRIQRGQDIDCSDLDGKWVSEVKRKLSRLAIAFNRTVKCDGGEAREIL
jgi:hypothetical protein